MLACPFCGAAESDRFTIDGATFAVFSCMFTPRIDPALAESDQSARLVEEYGSNGSAHFRATCDRLHLYVVKGEGARRLTEGTRP